MKIQIVGSGCDKCKKLAINVEVAAKRLGNDFEIEKVTDIDRIIELGVMTTPALVVDEKVISVGKVLSPDEVAVFLKTGNTCACKTSPEASNLGETSCSSSGDGHAKSYRCANDPQRIDCGGTGTGKKLLTALLLLFVVASVGFMVLREFRTRGIVAKKTGDTTPAESVAAKSDALIVYYFHRTQRCSTCKAIERLIQTALANKYPKELANGAVVFKSMNIDIPENAYVIKDFELASGTVVLQKNGKYEKLDQIWTLIREPEKFISYIQEQTAKQMTEN